MAAAEPACHQADCGRSDVSTGGLSGCGDGERTVRSRTQRSRSTDAQVVDRAARGGGRRRGGAHICKRFRRQRARAASPLYHRHARETHARVRRIYKQTMTKRRVLLLELDVRSLMAEAARGQRQRLCMTVMSAADVPQHEENSLAWLPSASVAMVTARRRLRAVVNAQLKRPTPARSCKTAVGQGTALHARTGFHDLQ